MTGGPGGGKENLHDASIIIKSYLSSRVAGLPVEVFCSSQMIFTESFKFTS